VRAAGYEATYALGLVVSTRWGAVDRERRALALIAARAVDDAPVTATRLGSKAVGLCLLERRLDLLLRMLRSHCTSSVGSCQRDPLQGLSRVLRRGRGSGCRRGRPGLARFGGLVVLRGGGALRCEVRLGLRERAAALKVGGRALEACALAGAEAAGRASGGEAHLDQAELGQHGEETHACRGRPRVSTIPAQQRFERSVCRTARVAKRRVEGTKSGLEVKVGPCGGQREVGLRRPQAR